MIFPFAIICGIFFSLLITYYLSWRFDLEEYAPRIPYKTFYHMYVINPDAFALWDTQVRYKHDTLEFRSFLDVIRYKRFHHRVTKQHVISKRNELTIEMLQSFQQDIEDYKQQQAEGIKRYSNAIVEQARQSTEKYNKLIGDTFGTTDHPAVR